MISGLAVTKRRLIVVFVACMVLAAGILVWQMTMVTEAAMLDPHPGLVGWWRFDEGTGTVAEDSSGNGNDGTVYGATWVSGKHGMALEFDGIDDYVRIADDTSLGVTDDLTVTMWIYIDSLASHMTPLDKHWAGEYFVKILSNGALRFSHGQNQAELSLTSSGEMTTGEWIHISVVRNTSSMEFRAYKNGDAYSGVGYSFTADTSTQPVYIGREDGQYNPFDGKIDEVRIYNRALTVAEIETMFQKGPDVSSRLLARIPKGTTQVIVTVSWQNHGNINVTAESPSQVYTEDSMAIYQKSTYDSINSDMLNIKRLSLSVTALTSKENWHIILESHGIQNYKITVEVR